MSSQATESVIDGLQIHDLKQIADQRGAVLHMLRTDSAGFAGFGECYFSEVAPGAVKAWKLHRRQTQNLAVPVGTLQLVVFDDRKGSKSEGRLQVMKLGRPDNYRRVTIPPGLWYGFSCLSEVPALLANCADIPHDPQESTTLPVDDPRFPFHWPSTKISDQTDKT
ncbi:dTDP-4-dehydrorhamnose 3,5-epimerase family protein [Lacisediminimonas profundi]|uniref:dTDP-4-dehydrorhamnose 3,5-epimerase family protein n=1 Tax=Lacisediminimonas profundi TaxID=2603856 RepID=UPI00124BB07B|nr:dTDP-4-dehydrorhamnose 3,5-epimerase family protein [Lacisediminimonas profundi]